MPGSARPRRSAGAEDVAGTGQSTVTDDSDDNGKSSGPNVALVLSFVLLMMVLPVAFFLLGSHLNYHPFRHESSHVHGAGTHVRGSASSMYALAKAQMQMHHNKMGAKAPLPKPQTTTSPWPHSLQQKSGLPAGPEQPASSTVGLGTFSMVQCSTTAGPITIAVHPEWAPHGAMRFLDMVRGGFFSTQVALFRSVRDFLCQTGIPGDPEVYELWKQRGNIEDDPQWLDQSDAKRMKRGYLSFAGGGKNSRGTEFFFSFRDIGLGSSAWEVPFGTLVGNESFKTMDHWYTGYGDLTPFGGKAPAQGRMYSEGLPYLKKNYPRIDYITKCDISGLPAPGCSGTVYNILKAGSGKQVVKGSKVTVHATGIIKESGMKFWSTRDPGQKPFSYAAGVGQVIKGWDQGLLGMKIGEHRQVIIPSHEGYGADGFPAWKIPPGGTLDFTLEVISIQE